MLSPVSYTHLDVYKRQPYAYSWPITGATNGAHTWTATAFDAVGNSSTTAGVPVTVNIDITPPTVALLSLIHI